MTTEQQNPEPWQQHRVRPVDWEETFRQNAWDFLANISESPRYSLVAGYVHKLVRHGHILDAGCGEGVLLEYLDLCRYHYTGFDLSPTAIQRARQCCHDVKLFSCSLDDFTPGSERYDLIIFNEVLTSLERPIEVLNRFYTFLRPSGHILISQFQNSDPKSNSFIFTRRFEFEIAAGSYRVVATSEALNCETGRRWRLYCLGDRRLGGGGAPGSGDPEGRSEVG